MLNATQGFTYNKFEKPNDWPKLKDTFDYQIENGKLLSANEHIYLSGPVTYTKVGSPTIKDNIVSGFSNSNYLKTTESFYNYDKAEIGIKIKTPTSVSFQNAYFLRYGVYDSENYSSSGLRINQDGTISFYPGTGGSIVANTSFNTVYWLKAFVDRVNRTASLYISTDGVNYTLVQALSNLTYWQKYDSPIEIGRNIPSRMWFFEGSIDLNETYIKVNNRLWFYGKNYTNKNMVAVPAGLEYNNTTTPSIGWVNTNTASEFQQFTEAPEGTMIGKDDTHSLAVETPIVNGELLSPKLVGPVDYTVVGSPTITDGVASGFKGHPNSPSWVKINQYVDLQDNFEIGVAFTTGATRNHGVFTSAYNSKGKINFSYPYMNILTFSIEDYNGNTIISFNSTSSKIDLNYNTKYILKITYNGTNYIFYIINPINQEILWTHSEESSQRIGDCSFGFGGVRSDTLYSALDGSIDLNNTYIKINGALWFGKEDWTPSTYTDNAIYLLGSHKADYSNYNQLSLTPSIETESDEVGSYNVWIDNQKVIENKTGNTLLEWDKLALTTGYSVTTPSALKAHTIKIEPTNSTDSIISFNTETIEESDESI